MGSPDQLKCVGLRGWHLNCKPTGLQASDRYLTSPCVKPPNPWQAVSGSNAGSLRGLESKSTLPRCMEMCESTDLMMQPDKQSQFQVRCISCKTLIHSIFAKLETTEKEYVCLGTEKLLGYTWYYIIDILYPSFAFSHRWIHSYPLSVKAKSLIAHAFIY